MHDEFQRSETCLYTPWVVAETPVAYYLQLYNINI